MLICAGLLAAGCQFDPGGLIAQEMGVVADDLGTDHLGLWDQGLDLGGDLAAVVPDLGLAIPFTPANVSGATFGLGGGQLVVPAHTVLTIDTTSASLLSGVLPAGAGLFLDAQQRYTVLALGSLEVEKNGTLRAQGQRPLVITVTGQAHIEGVVDVSAHDDQGGAGGAPGGAQGTAGGGCGGGQPGMYHPPPTADSGGAGGSFGGVGGAGGAGPSGAAVSLCTTACTQHCVLDCLTPLRGGSGGGGGGDTFGGDGGGGGGAIQISATQEIWVAAGGRISAGGGGGGPGGALGGSGAGGGSGGGIVLEAPTVTVDGMVLAGGGGGGGGGGVATSGKAGEDAAFAADPAPGGEGADELGGVNVGGAGGQGSGGGDLATNGDPGGIGSNGRGEGGGGGGGGRICIRTTGGTLGGTGTISPRTTDSTTAFTLLSLQ